MNKNLKPKSPYQLDLDDFNRQIREAEDILKALIQEHQSVAVTNIRFDQILGEKNALRIKINALKVRRDNMGRLREYAVPDELKSVPKQ